MTAPNSFLLFLTINILFISNSFCYELFDVLLKNQIMYLISNLFFILLFKEVL